MLDQKKAAELVLHHVYKIGRRKIEFICAPSAQNATDVYQTNDVIEFDGSATLRI